MTVHRFEQRHSYQTRNLKCACGKRFVRKRTFTQTVNPFNVDADGLPKAAALVQAEVAAVGKAWAPEPVCSACVLVRDSRRLGC